MFPTTCPHLASESIEAWSTTQPIPVITRKMLREWSRSRSHTGPKRVRGGRRLSDEPFSYKYLVANTIITTPDQSAIALPKSDPRWVPGLEPLYRQIHRTRILADAMLNEC
jgi:hypothetical protein